MMRSGEIDSRAASSRTARVASRLLYGPPNTIRGLSTRMNGIGLDIKPSPALCLAMIAAASLYSATPGCGPSAQTSDVVTNAPRLLAKAGLTFLGAHCAPALNAARRLPSATEKGTLKTERGRCFDYLLLTTPPLLPRCSPPLSSTKRAMVSTPSPARRLLNTNGRVPRMRLASRSMTASEAPTCGARSILLITSRSERGMPGPPLVSPAAGQTTAADAGTPLQDKLCDLASRIASRKI